jgi:hypothetical protein
MRFPSGFIRLLLLLLLAPVQARAQVDAAKLRGTWQVVSVRNLRTGAVDTISKRRLVLTRYTDRYWSYTYMDLARPTTSPDSFKRLAGEDRVRADYGTVWDDAGVMRYWAAGGNYWLVGADRHYTNLVSIEPYQVGLGNVETVVQVDDHTYIYRSRPDREGVQRETRQRRLDHYTKPAQPTRASLLKGLWQLMSIRNLNTAEVDDIAQKQTIWFHVSDSMWTHIALQKDRPNTTPAELAALRPAQRMQRNYDKIWNAEMRKTAQDMSVGNRFRSSAGSYRIAGDTVRLSTTLAIEPGMVGASSTQILVHIDENTYTWRTGPDEQGIVRELTHRRLD